MVADHLILKASSLVFELRIIDVTKQTKKKNDFIDEFESATENLHVSLL